MINIGDYAHQHGISYQAVSQQIKRYQDELNTHITKQGRTRYLDDYAIEFLNGKRIGKTLVVTDQTTVSRAAELEKENSELKDKLIKAHERIEAVLNDVKQLQNEKTSLIEDRQSVIDEARKESERKIEDAKRRADTAEAALLALKAEVEVLKNQPKGLFARLPKIWQNK